jgi:hypothetical protein
MTMAKPSKMKKTMYLFYVMAYVIKSEKSELEKANYGMQYHCFFKKVVCFYKYHVKIFKMTMKKAIKNEKSHQK